MLSIESHHQIIYRYHEVLTQRSTRTEVPTWKRVFDLGLALVVTIFILSWMIPIVGLLITLETPGPILYTQKRTGYRGRWFGCLKLRTMRHDPHATFRQATQNDNRITRVGRFLRKTNLDEMPQFLNVLIGDMSVVGPRPHALQHSAQYWNTMPSYRKRYRQRPGITGLAQVRGCRGETDQDLKMCHRIRYDRFYNQKRSVRLDIWICWSTLRAMLKGNVNAW